MSFSIDTLANPL